MEIRRFVSLILGKNLVCFDLAANFKWQTIEKKKETLSYGHITAKILLLLKNYSKLMTEHVFRMTETLANLHTQVGISLCNLCPIDENFLRSR